MCPPHGLCKCSYPMVDISRACSHLGHVRDRVTTGIAVTSNCALTESQPSLSVKLASREYEQGPLLRAVTLHDLFTCIQNIAAADIQFLPNHPPYNAFIHTYICP